MERSELSSTQRSSTSVTGNQWYYNGVAISGEKSQSFIATETGFYNVKLTVDNCVSQISDDLDVELTVTDVEGTQERKLILYPVPAHQSVSLKFDQYDEGSPVEILIYNNLSQPVVQKTLTGDQLDAPLDISSLPKGVYVLQAGQGNVRHQIKFVKEE